MEKHNYYFLGPLIGASDFIPQLHMAVNRKLLKEPLKKKERFGWHCPTCNGGHLEQKPDSFYKRETSESIQGHGHEAWDPAIVK